jgi:hypothetical protein
MGLNWERSKELLDYELLESICDVVTTLTDEVAYYSAQFIQDGALMTQKFSTNTIKIDRLNTYTHNHDIEQAIYKDARLIGEKNANNYPYPLTSWRKCGLHPWVEMPNQLTLVSMMNYIRGIRHSRTDEFRYSTAANIVSRIAFMKSAIEYKSRVSPNRLFCSQFIADMLCQFELIDRTPPLSPITSIEYVGKVHDIHIYVNKKLLPTDTTIVMYRHSAMMVAMNKAVQCFHVKSVDDSSFLAIKLDFELEFHSAWDNGIIPRK